MACFDFTEFFVTLNDESLEEHFVFALKGVLFRHIFIASILQDLVASVGKIDGEFDNCKLQGASDTIGPLSFGRQGFTFSSGLTAGPSSVEKQGRHAPDCLVPVFDIETLAEESGIFDAGTLPNISGVIGEK